MSLVRATRRPRWFGWVLVAGLGAGQAPAAEARAGAGEPESLACSGDRTIWSRLTAPRVAAYCAQIAFAQGAVWDAPRRAIAGAETAERIYPGGREARLVTALAMFSLGDVQLSHGVFESLGPSALEQAGPTFRLAAARAALRSGHHDVALRHYRHLALGVEQLSGSRERARVLLEAAVAVSYALPHGLDEATALVRQSRGYWEPLLEPISSALELLLQVRDGPPLARASWGAERYWELAWIVERTPRSRGVPGEVLPVLPLGEESALLAASSEALDAETRSTLWSQFLLLAPTAPAHVRAAAVREGGEVPADLPPEEE